MSMKGAKSDQGASTMTRKNDGSISDDGNLSENEESSFPNFANDNPMLLELSALRSTLAPLLGRSTPSVLDQLSSALEKYPDQAQWYLSRGMVNATLEKLDQAIQDLTTAIELSLSPPSVAGKDTTTAAAAAEGLPGDETICIAYLNRARARSELRDAEGAVSDAKLALEHATSNSKTECRNALALYQKKLNKTKEMLSSEPEIVHHGSGVVIEDITEEDAKIIAKKAGIIAAVRIAKGRQLADVGKEFRIQFNEKVKAYEEEARGRHRKEKKKNKKKKRNAQKALEKKAEEEAAQEEVVLAPLPPSSLPIAFKKEGEEEEEKYFKLYNVESFIDPHDPEITIERIHIPITYVESKEELSPSAAKNDGKIIDSKNGIKGTTKADKVEVEGLVAGLSVGAVDESKFDFLKRYNI